jgi:hypothetical protein
MAFGPRTRFGQAPISQLPQRRQWKARAAQQGRVGATVIRGTSAFDCHLALLQRSFRAAVSLTVEACIIACRKVSTVLGVDKRPCKR